MDDDDSLPERRVRDVERMARIEGKLDTLAERISSGFNGIKADLDFVQRTAATGLQAERELRELNDHAIQRDLTRLHTETVDTLRQLDAQLDRKADRDALAELVTGRRFSVTTTIAVLGVIIAIVAAAAAFAHP